MDFSRGEKCISMEQESCFRLWSGFRNVDVSQHFVIMLSSGRPVTLTLLLRKFLSVCSCYGGGTKRCKGISSKDSVTLSAGHPKDHLQPLNKVPVIKVWAGQRKCIWGSL